MGSGRPFLTSWGLWSRQTTRRLSQGCARHGPICNKLSQLYRNCRTGRYCNAARPLHPNGKDRYGPKPCEACACGQQCSHIADRSPPSRLRRTASSAATCVYIFGTKLRHAWPIFRFEIHWVFDDVDTKRRIGCWPLSYRKSQSCAKCSKTSAPATIWGFPISRRSSPRGSSCGLRTKGKAIPQILRSVSPRRCRPIFVNRRR